MQQGKSKSKRPTSYDVANLAGVSQATVSLVLSGKGARVGISPVTEKKVLDAVQALSYYPNTLIRSLQQRRTGIIGLYAHDHGWGARNIYWSEVMAAFHAAVASKEQELLVFSDVPGRPLPKLLERMLGGIADGLVVQPGPNRELLEALIRSKIPLVCIGDHEESVPRVCLDNGKAMEVLVSHLIEKGYRSLAMVNWHTFHPGAAFQREEAFLTLTREAQVLSNRGVIRFYGNPSVTLEEIVSAVPKIDAVVCFNDEMGYEILKAAEERGVNIPGDLALVGHDGLPGGIPQRQLTTMRSPIMPLCEAALDKLGLILEGEEVEPCTRFVAELLVGATT